LETRVELGTFCFQRMFWLAHSFVSHFLIS
jgi:hypothetical protein